MNTDAMLEIINQLHDLQRNLEIMGVEARVEIHGDQTSFRRMQGALSDIFPYCDSPGFRDHQIIEVMGARIVRDDS